MSFPGSQLIALFVGLGGLVHPADSAATSGVDSSLESALKVVRERCFECHAAGNVKGGLRLDEAEGWKKSIDRESPADSELLYRLRLPAGDVDAMPPEGDRIAADQTSRLESWIIDGADLAPLESFLSRSALREENRKSSLAALAESLGARVTELRAGEGVKAHRGLGVSWSHQPSPPTREQIQRLQPIAEQTIELSFAGTAITDSMLGALPELPALARVHLERTAVSGRGVAALLQRAPALRYLNLHSTAVQASLLSDLPELKRVETLVLFGTPAAAPSVAHPFAEIVGFQPRRLLAVDRANGRVVLLREVGLDTYEILSERAGPLGPDAAPVRWLGGTRSSETARRKGIDDGHGRVQIQAGPGRWVHWDTRSGESTETSPSSVGDRPFRAARGTTPQRLASGHRILVLPPRKASPERPLPEGEAPRPQIVEKNAAGEIIWTFTDAERFPQGFTSVEVIERTP